MKILFKALLFFWIIVSYPVFSVSAENKIRIAIGEWTPYFSEKYRDYGVVPHVVTEAFRLVGVQVKYSFLPWERGKKNARRGLIDASCCWDYSKKRAKFFYFTDTVHSDSYVFFHHKRFPFNWKSINDLKGVEIGLIIGFNYSPEFDAGVKNGELSVHFVPTDKMNFLKILKNRIHIFPHSKFVGYYMINELFKPIDAKQFTHHPKILVESNPKIIISRKSINGEKWKELFNKGLKKLKESGVYSKMMNAAIKGEYKQNQFKK